MLIVSWHSFDWGDRCVHAFQPPWLESNIAKLSSQGAASCLPTPCPWRSSLIVSLSSGRLYISNSQILLGWFKPGPLGLGVLPSASFEIPLSWVVYMAKTHGTRNWGRERLSSPASFYITLQEKLSSFLLFPHISWLAGEGHHSPAVRTCFWWVLSTGEYPILLLLPIDWLARKWSWNFSCRVHTGLPNSSSLGRLSGSLVLSLPPSPLEAKGDHKTLEYWVSSSSKRSGQPFKLD